MTNTGVIDEEIIVEAEADDPLTPRQQFLRELRGVLDLLDANPELPYPNSIGNSEWSSLSWYPNDPLEAAKIVKALGGRWEKNDPNKSEHDATYLRMKAKLGLELHVDLLVSREGVCEKTVVGTERKKVERVVQERVVEEVYADVDVIKFECKSLLSVADQKVMDELEALAE